MYNVLGLDQAVSELLLSFVFFCTVWFCGKELVFRGRGKVHTKKDVFTIWQSLWVGILCVCVGGGGDKVCTMYLIYYLAG